MIAPPTTRLPSGQSRVDLDLARAAIALMQSAPAQRVSMTPPGGSTRTYTMPPANPYLAQLRADNLARAAQRRALGGVLYRGLLDEVTIYEVVRCQKSMVITHYSLPVARTSITEYITDWLESLRQSRSLAPMMCLLCLLTGCTVKPTIAMRANGTQVISLGGSVLTKADAEVATIRLPNGTILDYSVQGKDEVVALRAYLQSVLGARLAQTAGSVTRSLSQHQLQATQSADAVRIHAQQQATEQIRIQAAPIP